jgi:hypothetical protein
MPRPASRSNICRFKWPRNHIMTSPLSFPLYSPLQTFKSTSDDIPPTMSFNFIPYTSGDIAGPTREDPCFPPLAQLNESPSPELFDQEVDDDNEVNEFHCPSEKMDAFFHSPRDPNPDISTRISIPSAFTNSTGSSYEIESSQYSFNVTSSGSEYLSPLEFETRGSVNSWLDMQAFTPSPEFTGPLPPLNTAEAHGTMDLSSNLLTHNYPTSMQQLGSVACVDPAALSVRVNSESEAQKASAWATVKKPFECPHCSFCKSEPMCICNWLTLLDSLCL